MNALLKFLLTKCKLVEARTTETKYFKIDDFTIRVSEHFTTKEGNDLDIIFLSSKKYIIIPVKAACKRPIYCSTFSQGIEYITNWLKYVAPYFKLPSVNSIALEVNKTEEESINVDDTVPKAEIADTDNRTLKVDLLFEKLHWTYTNKSPHYVQWNIIKELITSIIDKYSVVELIGKLNPILPISLQNKIIWIKKQIANNKL